MTTFKEFIKLTEAGVGLSGNNSSGTSLQKNRPGSENMFSPSINYGTSLKDRQQEEFAWKNNIYSFVLHLESAHSLIKYDGRYYIDPDVIQGGTGHSPWHHKAVEELRKSGVLGNEITIQLPVYLLDGNKSAFAQQQGLIKQNDKTYLPVGAGFTPQEIINMEWSPNPQETIINVILFPINIDRANIVMRKLAAWRNTLNVGYDMASGMTDTKFQDTTAISQLYR